jgi:hypothetical protein
MASKKFAKGLKRSALTVALGLCFAGGVQAQSSVGSVNGDTAANATVSIQNPNTGYSREITADASGHFTFPQLAPGTYTVTSGGQTQQVQVRVGTGSTVSLVASDGSATTLGAVTVVGSASFNPIDVSSVESTTVFTAAQIAELPVARDITNVALLAPGTVKGDSGFGNLASFGGSSVAENGYYINGFDVTNIRNFIAYASLPFDAIGEQQVKTGGYGAEFGRSLGGVINIVTKRGTNTWEGGASATWAPSSLTEHGKDVYSRDPERIGDPTNDRLVYRSDNESDSLVYNVWGGGPLVKDRLFMFGLVQGQDYSSDSFGRITSSHASDNSPSGMLKLDWNITDNHILEFTGIYNKDSTDYVDYQNGAGSYYSGQHENEIARYSVTNGGNVLIGKYTGYLTDSFTISAQYGRLENDNAFREPVFLPGSECPPIYDSRAPGLPLNPLGCWNTSQFTIRDPAFGDGPEQDIRKAWRVDGEWLLGNHDIRFGYDSETFTSTHAGVTYSGGDAYYRYFRAGDVFGEDYAFLGDVVRVRHTFSQTGSYEVINKAAYIEDSWQLTDKFVVYGGLRAESFQNNNGDGVPFVKSDTLMAPRLGFAWDVNGDSTFKVFGNAGRYYIPVASNTSIRGSSFEYSDEAWYFLNGINADGTPQIGDVLIPNGVNGSLVAPDPRTVAAINLKPMYQDEYILGFQHTLGENWSVGLRGIHREVKAGMDDYCGHDGPNQWAADNGFDPEFSQDGVGIDLPTCYLVNPGSDLELAMDPDNDGDLEVYTIPASYLGIPQYARKYQALEFFFERAKADGWYMQGSYTYAKSRGNVEGYVNSTLQQDDAGVTQDFDFGAFEDGAYGYLPNDRRHTLKLFGAYDITDEWSVSANLLVQSGRPVNCNGFIPVEALGLGPEDTGSISNYSGSSFYCIDPAGAILDPETNVRYRLHNRGDMGRTPWTRSIDLGFAYTPRWADGHLNLSVKVFNALNSQTVTEYNESSQQTKEDNTLWADYLNDVNYQSPRYVRFTASYKF